ncbi:ribosome biogenesis GTP-binding protein YihA/YsxC [Magnetospirillum sp. 64-120]|uniref:ribosome biogenesis GTP-binding protein YihA/YsxC n=1 Tax=Magnetospirillum sp. 64-120 TaxID=1895778 RepID=UPI00092777A4|nr:ribosome biogenesis GTP-binding protein YihA/YsxC [Magnetospirillum sp. 64-120]OJX68498.1 MAG: YihA family ribosome biogenesis GTP-binding protein [Magnetospirillum sp. 64-120]
MGDHAEIRGEVLSAPDTNDAAAAGLIEAGRLLFARDITFLRGAVDLVTLPPFGLPELAFAGRSNVGKSSLINALCGRSTVARTSNTPGRTQELNFFDVNSRLILVDMPGYGFASAPKDKVDAWTRLIKGYLRGRPTLRRCVLLVDSRHGIKDNDREMMDMLDKAAVVYQVVLTKIDKLNKTEAEAVESRTLEEIAKRVAAFPRIVVTSSEKGIGIPELRAEIVQLANPESVP